MADHTPDCPAPARLVEMGAADKAITVNRELMLRIMSAIVLVVLYFGSIFLGGFTFVALVSLTGILAVWEWGLMVQPGADNWTLTALRGCPLIGSAACGLVGLSSSLVVLLIILPIVVLAQKRADREAAVVHALGALYVCTACVLLVWLRLGPDTGAALVLWLLAVVIASDIGAFVFGRAIGGPRLAPQVSPGKTWSGGIGGLCVAIAVGVLVTVSLGEGVGLRTIVAAAVIAFAAQVGDLLESAAKRRFGVKDSGRLIPGHGGVLDRIDGLLLAIPVFAAGHILVHGREA